MQDRTLLATDGAWRVERVRAHTGTAQWSPVYHAPSRRLVLPGSGALHFRNHACGLLIDSLTAFCVDAAMAYQLMPESDAPAGTRLSVVVSESPGMHDASRPLSPHADAWLLPPAALYHLRLHWRALERGQATLRQTSGVLARALGAGKPVAAARCEQAPAVLRARRFMLAQPGASHTLHDVADAAFSSAFHLARTFRRHTGLSLHQYRLRLRMAAALALLEEGERDLAGLAHYLGFCSQSHFGAQFRGAVGVSPAQARAALAP
jgi:AraC-like DNA-binding protein